MNNGNLKSTIDTENIINNLTEEIKNKILHKVHIYIDEYLTIYINNVIKEKITKIVNNPNSFAIDDFISLILTSNIEYKEGINYAYIDGLLHISENIFRKTHKQFNKKIRLLKIDKNVVLSTNKQVRMNNGIKFRCISLDTDQLPESVIKKMPMTVNRTHGGHKSDK